MHKSISPAMTRLDFWDVNHKVEYGRTPQLFSVPTIKI